MIHWNDLTLSERISEWRLFRESISELSIPSKVDCTVDFFKSLPVSSRRIDFYSPETWPSPWEIFAESLFCKSSITLLFYYTLTIVEPDINIELEVIDDGEDMYIVPVWENEYILNYIPGKIIDRKSATDLTYKQLIDKREIRKL